MLLPLVLAACDYEMAELRCRSHTDCGANERCEQGLCEVGCRDDADCEGGYCNINGFFGSYECFELPEPIECGDNQCRALRSIGFLGGGPLPPCCRDASASACGVDVGSLVVGDTSVTPSCAEYAGGDLDGDCPVVLGLPGCRTYDGRCAALLAEECVLVTELPSGADADVDGGR